MKRWNGWGEETTTYPLPETSAQFLAMRIGQGEPAPDATFHDVLATVPPSRLPAHPLILTDADERLRHARGQSLPDWVALRSGEIGSFPDGVAYPTTDADIQSLIGYAQKTDIALIPYGGGSSVVGHINPSPAGRPVLTLDLSRLNHLLSLDEKSCLATFEAGARGHEIEAQLRSRGFTLGHFPQSFEFSTLGGWVATRSSVQQSVHYGRIEALFAGGHVETPIGGLELPPYPASAAGPDLRKLILGSEGRFGVLTRAIVRLHPLPEAEEFYGVFFPDWEASADAVRAIVQNEIPVSMLRASDALETETTLALSGKERMLHWAERGLRLLGYSGERCLLIFGVTGTRRALAATRTQTLAITRAFGGLFTGNLIGKMWRKSRFLTPYLRNTLWECGYAIDTLETALPWTAVLPAAQAIQTAIRQAIAEGGERALVFAHLSHVYRDGASLYITVLFRRASPEVTLRRWQSMKNSASQAVLAHGGTISHQHGIGMDHAPYLPAEKGEIGITVLQNLCRVFDPRGIMNPGKLV